MSIHPKIRNDGKVRREPLLGLAPSSHNGLSAEPETAAPSWHELVQPGGKGDKGRTHQRREERGQVVPITGTVLVDMSSAIPRTYRRAGHGRSWNPGRLILHARSAFRPAEGDDTQPRSSVLARRLNRRGRA